MEASKKQTILERLNAGEVIICDGGYTHAFERRGYVTAGPYTPEVVVEHPSAVTELHREFALSGADILEAFAFNGTDDNLNRSRSNDTKLVAKEVSEAGCRLANEVAKEYNCLVAGPISPTSSYTANLGKEKVQKEFQAQVDVFKSQNMDLLMAEYFSYVEEAEWAVEVMKRTGMPVAISLCIGPLGDFNDITVEECGIRLARTGADIIGTNCRFSPDMSLDTMIRMKKAVEKEGLSKHWLCQPVGFRTADAGKEGFENLPECSLALESRLISRWDAHKFARRAYEAGVRFIGGCCGFEPYHIRALAEELHKERGRLPKNSRGLYASSLKHHHNPIVRDRANKEYWYNLVPTDGRKKL
ncbi:betaine--homocysteine S-methyltransferase 1-like isoform X2 [Hydractinia symbiolongicarpus]|uniref:betaine--homocysteine S-methyltransferase 1-like isoform X2 n=1 Tax=Hydractinia symbiolongicarpus TaxID=13093 RepID=UPI0025516721|nr:betaine--homocysteine S-methyltransferase 1-like isoform X2 [Hydractinia symbiolongicarpus]